MPFLVGFANPCGCVLPLEIVVNCDVDTDETPLVSVDDFGILADTSDSVCENHDGCCFSGSWLVCRFLGFGCCLVPVLCRGAGQVALAFYIGLTELVAFLLIPCSPCAHFFLHRLLHRRIAFLLASRKEASRHAVCKQFQGLLAEYPDCKRSLQSAEGCRQKGAEIGVLPYPGACIQSRCLYLRKVKSVKYGEQQSPMQTVRITARNKVYNKRTNTIRYHMFMNVNQTKFHTQVLNIRYTH